ncbi:MAG: hypothetical protein AUJ55_00435 [Proteobacteria bacterium CG1_02_64_396]|nr:MAG: hypothetical protein AUJ55_00435 [Proteobacteria bacterium CG1_02_64_396]
MTAGREQLLPYLNLLNKTADIRHPNRLLGSVYIEVMEGASLRMTASNGSHSLRVATVVEMEGAGSPAPFCVDADLLYRLFSGIPSGATVQLHLEGDEAGRVSGVQLGWSGNKAKYRIAAISGDQFPALAYPEEVFVRAIEPAAFAQMLRTVGFAMMKDPNREAFHGSLVQFAQGGDRVVATNMHLLAMSQRGLGLSDEAQIQSIVPYNAVGEIVAVGEMAKEGSGRVTMDQDHLLFRVERQGDTVDFVTSVVNKPFPEFQHLFPAGEANRLLLSRDDLYDAVKRLKILYSVDHPAITFEAQGDQLSIHAVSAQNDEGQEVLSLLESAPEVRISFNGDYIAQIVERIDEATVELRFASVTGPTLIRGADNEDRQFILQPLEI